MSTKPSHILVARSAAGAVTLTWIGAELALPPDGVAVAEVVAGQVQASPLMRDAARRAYTALLAARARLGDAQPILWCGAGELDAQTAGLAGLRPDPIDGAYAGTASAPEPSGGA